MEDTEQQIVEIVSRRLKYLRPGQRLGLDEPLKPLGLDSMASIDLLIDLEDAFDVTVGDADLTEANFLTARSLHDMIVRLRSTPAYGGTTP
ncbi:MAG TPA: acyl carrier protein [Candidatus Dormibacteraeota bacterium]|nr:acyl carrier protein [Candidatus Dormibacteraeota bacterium]